jgi:hypothetical protein
MMPAFAQDMSIYGFYRENGTPPENFVTLAKMDPLSGSIDELDTISPIYAYALGSSTFDQANQFYIFKGVDTGNVMKLISRDVTNNITVFAPKNEITINDFQYDMNSQNLYALGNYISDSILIDTMNGGTYLYEYATNFMAMNIQTGESVEVGQISNLSAFPVGNSTFDSNNGRYIVSGYDSTFVTRIFVINPETGETIQETPVSLLQGEYLNELEYNNEDNNLYGIYRNNNSNTMAIASVSIQTGEIEVVEVIEDAFAFTPGASVFDQMSQSFIFFYFNAAMQTRLITYDVSEGVVISNVPVDGYFTEIEVDNSAYATLKYGTTAIWPSTLTVDQLEVYPNPAESEFRVFCENKFSTIKVYDLTGNEVYHSTCVSRNEEIIASNEFKPGIYFVRVETGSEVHTSKVVIE